jgi:hypothetical protein
MNVFLLAKIKAAILEEPERFDMNGWECGTTACIAGWASRLSGQRMAILKANSGSGTWLAFGEDLRKAQKSLKLEDDQWYRLVHVDNWPDPFKKEYNNALLSDGLQIISPCLEQAQIAARRIDHFIATEGSE